MIDLAQIARRLGGEASGDQVYCPGPGHSPRDRSLAVKFTDTGFIVHSYAGDNWAACRDHVASLIAGTALPPRIVLPHETEKNLARARHLWSCRADSKSTLVEKYLNARGIAVLPASIGYLAPGAYSHPAMIAAFGIPDEPEPGVLSLTDPHGIHLTFLKTDGSGKADTDRPKIMLGPSCSFPIVVGPSNNLLGLAITEGIEDALSVHEATGLGAWAAGSASRMTALATRVPGYIETVTILAHSDAAGQRGAYQLADTLSKLNIEVLIEGLA